MTIRPLALYLGALMWPATRDQLSARTAGLPGGGRVTRAARAFAHASTLGGPRLGDFDSVEDDYYRFLNRPRG